LGTLYRNIEKSTNGDKATASKLKEDKLKSSMLSNTVSLTVMKAGYKTNVIPAESYCELDCRLLPGVDHQAFIKQIKEILQDDSIEVSVIQWEKAEPSPFESAFVKAVKKVNARESQDGKTPVVPVIVPWFTDSHWFREVGLKAYGFAPVEIDAEHLATMHGKDERLPITSFNKGIDRLTLILQELAQLD
jgi:acetylornithine deacetylase/succinyl-diaminopimelate desuccinylase-like protein